MTGSSGRSSIACAHRVDPAELADVIRGRSDGGSREGWRSLCPGLQLGSDAAYPICLDPDDQPLFAGLAEGVLVPAEEPLRELVDVRVGTGVRDSGGAVDDHVRLRL